MPTSIRRRLALLVLASLAVVWSLALGLSYHQAKHEIAQWDDARLAQLAQFLVLLDQNDLDILAKTRIDARNEYGHKSAQPNDDDGDKSPREALFQIQDASGKVLAQSARLAVLGGWQSQPDPGSGAQTITLNGQLWRSYRLRDGSTGRTVRVLESANNRSDLTTDVARRIARPIAFALPVLAILVWFSIGHSLAPLAALSRAICIRDASKLDPIEIGPTPHEVRPLVDAINQLLARLRLSISRERAFTADAAHELKTPLAAIKVQAQVALVTDDAIQQRLAMQRVVQGVDRSTHLAEQLLLLARLDEHEPVPAQPVELVALARDAIAAHELDVRRKGIRTQLVGHACVQVLAAPALMNILLDNLIDNAIKYGDAGGRFEIAIQRDGHAVTLTISDDGPGVTAEELARLTDRFFRGSGTSANGSGLGLSIVARIAGYFGAALDFGPGIGGRGLSAKVTFPRSAVLPGSVAVAMEK
jgi:two-component system, OmpR family, sensor histidine kinase QseC